MQLLYVKWQLHSWHCAAECEALLLRKLHSLHAHRALAASCFHFFMDLEFYKMESIVLKFFFSVYFEM